MSFMDCVMLHLQMVFADDTAEKECYYISSNVLKKPQHVPVRYFFQRLEQLNGYLLHLPSTHDSPRVNVNTREIKSYDKAELACLALRMCPETWQDQHDLMQDSVVPQSMRKLLTVLKTIKKMMENQAAKEKGKSPKQENTTDSEKSGKRKGKGRGNFTLKVFEYSKSNEFLAEPDVVEYEKDEMKPVFDLILGIQSMHELGIILDCKNKMITIDEITLPMRNIHSLTKSQKSPSC
jgi:hypothetical protein